MYPFRFINIIVIPHTRSLYVLFYFLRSRIYTYIPSWIFWTYTSIAHWIKNSLSEEGVDILFCKIHTIYICIYMYISITDFFKHISCSVLSILQNVKNTEICTHTHTNDTQLFYEDIIVYKMIYLITTSITQLNSCKQLSRFRKKNTIYFRIQETTWNIRYMYIFIYIYIRKTYD